MQNRGFMESLSYNLFTRDQNSNEENARRLGYSLCQLYGL